MDNELETKPNEGTSIPVINRSIPNPPPEEPKLEEEETPKPPTPPVTPRLPMENDTTKATPGSNPSPQAPNEKKAGKSKLPWIIVIVLILLLGGVIAWLYFQNTAKSDSLATTESQLESTQTSLTIAKQDLANAKKQLTDSEAEATPPTDAEQIVATVTAWTQGQTATGSANAKNTITVSKTQLPFARVNVAQEVGGYYCILKKSNDIWLVLVCGQDTPDEDTIKLWSIPDTMLK